MILYVNGDSHSAGAEAVNLHCFAEDDSRYIKLGRQAHPDNLEVSYGTLLAQKINAQLICAAESASSNTRIIRTTRDFLTQNTPDIVVIGWATWEREEWLHNNVYWQITGGGTDTVPQELQEKYKTWIIKTANSYASNELAQHESIWNFHVELEQQNIPHLFFNTYSYFGHVVLNDLPKYDWGPNYLEPYNENFTYYYWLKNQGIKTVKPESYHFGPDAHKKWAEFLLPRLTALL